MKQNITLENIQTCYRWTKEELSKFDFIVVDEAHLIVTEENSQLIVNAVELNIPIMCLTATPDDGKEEKKLFYEKYVPIIYRYKNGVQDGIINKRRHLVLYYQLDDNNKVTVNVGKKSFLAGEKKQYEYYDKVMKESSEYLKNRYFDDMKQKFETTLKLRPLEYDIEDINFLKDALSKDLEYFYEVTQPRYTNRDLSIKLYYLLKEIKGINYSLLGLNAQRLLGVKSLNQDIRTSLAKYVYAMNARKEFLWNLNSTARIAELMKNYIIRRDSNNKVLIFSERTEHVEKITKYTVHSKKDIEKNKDLISKFNSGEIRELGSCHSLGLGLNLKHPNYAIIESFNGSDVLFLQRAGRTDRLPVDEIATVIFIVPKDTQAEEWFKTATKDINDIEYYNTLLDLINNL